VTRVAAIDCGTNSIRLLVTDLDGGGKSDVHREMRVVRLGQGVDETGSLHPDAIERTRVALVDYARTCADLGVERTRMVATSATRDADNRAVFVDMVEQVLGVPPEVVTGTEEAALSFAGATGDLVEGDPFLVLDIGGGSTELVLGSTGVEASCSVDVGCVRLTERHLRDDPPTAAQVEKARADVDAALWAALEVVPAERARTAVGLAGSVTTVAALALGLEAYDPDAIHLSRVSAEQVEEITERLLAMTRDERAALPVMHPGRVDVIGGGALVLQSVVRRLGLVEVLVSESDILDGIALSLREPPEEH
jgi:exopolyphosphatase / guanosine-5'-triphosphate,3'-diphosphate pyrophosphatase